MNNDALLEIYALQRIPYFDNRQKKNTLRLPRSNFAAFQFFRTAIFTHFVHERIFGIGTGAPTHGQAYIRSQTKLKILCDRYNIV